MRRERRNPFRAALVIEPLWRRFALGGGALAVYAMAFLPLYGQSGVGVSAVSIFPVVILAWLFGAWGGLVAGLLTIPLNALLLGFAGEPGWSLVVGAEGLEAEALIVVVGGVIGLLRDLGVRLDRHLTEWRKAERALRATEDRYRILFERSRDPMYVSEPDGRIVEANDALVRFFEYERTELMDLEVSLLYEDPEDRERFRDEVTRVGYVEDFPVRLRTKSGRVKDGLITASVRYGPERSIVAYQGSIRDVSHSQALHALAERRTLELQRTIKELESFTYSVSHDLRTHLVTMGGFASILWSDYRDVLDEKGRGFLERIVIASRRMDSFVQDLLAYSRVSRTEVVLERVELDEVVHGAVTALQSLIEDRGAHVEVAEGLPAVEADRVLLERVVENLLSNAVKFVPEDRTPTVSVEADPEERRVRLKVRDNGVGMAVEQVGRAFRAFERLEPGRFPGTGVGLTIVQKSLERMGGEVGVRSTPGEGSTFWIVLPSALSPELEE